jgi:plasmid maintenance system antidote protein VapI
MYKQITIKTLHKQGLKQSDIAKQLGCHRHTIANVLQRENFIEKQTRIKGSLFDPYQTQIQEWIKQEVSILRQFEILTQTYGVKSTYSLSRMTLHFYYYPIVSWGFYSSDSSMSSRHYRSSSLCISAITAWHVSDVTLSNPSSKWARSPCMV